MPSLTDSIGRVLGDRYRLLTGLGTGASAHVYLADDVSLHRQVAIKVLHPALADDQAFLRRFRAEARAVAALNHPNILHIYDWGEEDGEPYLVLEYLAGGSLRQVYDTGALLTPEQAVRVGLEVAAGLDYAHRRGLVHRDIKPANLLLGGDRRVRITDFGLARALAEAAWTEPDGAILGTARYAAPEQVEGWVLDGKADVYALALVLYEGVTGQTPFIGDTTVTTLMARVGALLPEHEALGALNDVLAWAAAPDPSERYDASQLALRLQALAVALPESEPLPTVDALAHEEAVDPDEVMIGPVVRPQPAPEGHDLTELGTPGEVGREPASVRRRDERRSRRAEQGDDEEPRARRRWPWIATAVVVAAAVIAAGVAYAIEHKVFTPSHPVPALLGRSLPVAARTVRADHFAVHSTGSRFSITVPAGLILSQQPSARSAGRSVTAKEGTTIDVVLSSGPPPVAIPNLTTFTSCNDAIQALAAVHLVGVCPAAAAQYSSTVVAGAILDTAPHGSAPYGSTVTIITSKGHAPVALPPLTGVGSSYPAASAALTAAAFVPAESTQYDPTVPAGQVIGTSPPASAGPQPFGSTVTVDVSLGPQPVAIPDLTGRSVSRATAALEALGLNVAGPYGPPGSATVVSTSPAAGASVLPGTTVIVYAQ